MKNGICVSTYNAQLSATPTESTKLGIEFANRNDEREVIGYGQVNSMIRTLSDMEDTD